MSTWIAANTMTHSISPLARFGTRKIWPFDSATDVQPEKYEVYKLNNITVGNKKYKFWNLPPPKINQKGSYSIIIIILTIGSNYIILYFLE